MLVTQCPLLAGYIIEKQRLKTKWLKVVTLEPSVQQFCVENLKEKSEYYFKVYAENTVGLSEPALTDLVSLETHSSKFSDKTPLSHLELLIFTKFLTCSRSIAANCSTRGAFFECKCCRSGMGCA